MSIQEKMALITVIAISTIAIVGNYFDASPSQTSTSSPPQANTAASDQAFSKSVASAKRPSGDLREVLLDNEVTYALPMSREAVLSHLRDPASAQFRNVAVVRSKQGRPSWVFCGEVNAKNGFGGYTGFVPFYAIGDTAYVLGNDRQFERMFRLNCLEGTPVRTASFD